LVPPLGSAPSSPGLQPSAFTRLAWTGLFFYADYYVTFV